MLTRRFIYRRIHCSNSGSATEEKGRSCSRQFTASFKSTTSQSVRGIVKPSGYIDEWFASIVKPKSFYEKHARKEIPDNGTRNTTTRCYFYNIDMQGRLFLEETLPKNIATSIKDARFLDFFFARLKHVSDAHRAYMTAHGIPVADYPFVSVCGKELNFVRPAATPIVFHSLVDNNKNNGHDGHRLDLVFGGNTLLQPFDELQGIAISERTGRLYHKLTTHSLFPSGSSSSTNRSYDEYGLIRSAVAVTLSARIVVVLDGTDINTTNLQHSGMGFQTAAKNNGSIVPIPWLPSDAELGPWAMPFTGDE